MKMFSFVIAQLFIFLFLFSDIGGGGDSVDDYYIDGLL